MWCSRFLPKLNCLESCVPLEEHHVVWYLFEREVGARKTLTILTYCNLLDAMFATMLLMRSSLYMVCFGSECSPPPFFFSLQRRSRGRAPELTLLMCDIYYVHLQWERRAANLPENLECLQERLRGNNSHRNIMPVYRL